MFTEFTYPDYSIANNYISDLGSFTHPVPAIFFNISIRILGALAVYTGLLLKTSFDKWLGILLILAGAGGIGVGIFNEDTVLAIHYLSAFTVFIFVEPCEGIDILLHTDYFEKRKKGTTRSNLTFLPDTKEG